MSWIDRKRPARLERRIEFPDYEATRVFLDQLAELSEQQGIYPDTSFGRTYVNLTLYAEGEGEGEDLGEGVRGFAEAVDRILAAVP